MQTYLKVAASLLSVTLCAALIVLWMGSYKTTYSLKAPIVGCAVVMEGQCWFGYGFWEYALHAPYHEGYAGYQWGGIEGWTIDIYTITGPTTVPEEFKRTIAIWSPVPMAAVLVAAPWVRWRFSIRGLLVVTAIVAICLCLLTTMAAR